MERKSVIACDICGRPVTNGRKHIGRNKHFFCSKECYLQFKTKKQEVRCDWCGTVFMKKRSDIARTEHNFCSADCSASYIRWTGKGNRSAKFGGEAIHRLLAEEKLGRKLLPDEEVHHVDHNHFNNRPENLMVLSKSEHSKIHAARKERDDRGRFTSKEHDA